MTAAVEPAPRPRVQPWTLSLSKSTTILSLHPWYNRRASPEIAPHLLPHAKVVVAIFADLHLGRRNPACVTTITSPRVRHSVMRCCSTCSTCTIKTHRSWRSLKPPPAPSRFSSWIKSMQPHHRVSAPLSPPSYGLRTTYQSSHSRLSALAHIALIASLPIDVPATADTRHKQSNQSLPSKTLETVSFRAARTYCTSSPLAGKDLRSPEVGSSLGLGLLTARSLRPRRLTAIARASAREVDVGAAARRAKTAGI